MKPFSRTATALLAVLLLLPLACSCEKDPEGADSIEVIQAQRTLEACAGRRLLQTYSTPDATLALPFADGTYAEIAQNTIKALSDDGQSIRITLLNKSAFTFAKDRTFPAPGDSPLTLFAFRQKDNPFNLKGDIVCDIEGNHVTCRLPYLTENRQLIPELTLPAGLTAKLRSNPAQDIHSLTDFSKTVIYDISGGTRKDSVTVTLLSNTRLPVMSILTEDYKEIVSKETYLKATVAIDDNLLSLTHGNGSLEPTDVKIKGRGNSTWMEAKKPYKLKFDKKTSLLGEAEGKQWVLLANACDPSLLHNDTAFEMARILDFEWTPCSHFVDLFINHTYRGTYQLTEQIKINKNRVNVTDDGFIVEIDQHMKIDAEDVTFKTPKIKNLTIKDPDVEKGSDQYNAIVKTVRDFEETLYGEQWLDPDSGYKTLADIKSFARWYVIHEISNHADHVFGSSCYFHKAPKGKITMGPVWDFDKSFGTLTGETATAPSRLQHAPWYERMFQDPAFVEEVNRQFTLFREAIPQLNDWIDETYNYLLGAYVENNIRWENLYLRPYEYDAARNKALQEKDKTKKYISDRAAWLSSNLPK